MQIAASKSFRCRHRPIVSEPATVSANLERLQSGLPLSNRAGPSSVLRCEFCRADTCLPAPVCPNLLVMCLREMCVSLAQQGFKNIFLLLAHGGSENIKVLQASLPMMIRENPVLDDVMIAYTPFWRYADKFMKGFHTDGDGHAGNGETAMVMYFRPELVQLDQARQDGPEVLAGMRQHPDYYQKHEKPCDAPEVLPRITQKDEVQVGVMGDIGSASREIGRELVEETIAKMCELYRKLLADRTERYVPVQPDLGDMVL